VFLTSRVIDDIAFGLIAKGTASSVAREAATTELAHCGLEHLSNRAPGTLSSGEAALVALVMVMATKPQLLLLDEPLSALSRPSAERFMALLERYRVETGATVLMTDHPRGDATLAGWEYWQLGATGIAPGRHQATPGVSHRIPYRPHEADRVLRVSDLSVSFGEHVVLKEVSLDVSRGETCLIVGDNAAGKSTLLRALATSSEAEIELRGVRLSGRTAHRRVSSIAAVPSEPQDLLISSSVAEELRLADRIARVQEGMTALTLESILPALWHTPSLASQHPRDLSRGQQTALAIAIQLSHKPAVLLLDEPMRGLDEAARSALAEVLACVVETGTAVVVASHHAHQADLPHDRVLHLEKGLLVEKLVEVPQ
jgi:energy-coupling factor transport system ATP-binding protein